MILIILDIKDKVLEKRVFYSFEQIMSYLGYPYKIKAKADKNSINGGYSLLIYYGNKTLDTNKNIIQIMPGFRIKDAKQKRLYYFRDKKVAVFSHDFILESFRILSREEEINSKHTDKHKRFIAQKSGVFRYLREPLVNKYAFILESIIKKIYKKNNTPIIQKCRWPENKKFAACLSHDVDIVRHVKSDIFDLRKILDLIRGKNPYWQFNEIINLEQKFNFKSTYFFSVEKRHRLDPNYCIREKRIRKIISHLKESGNEIGIHLSYLSYNNKGLMLMEKRELKPLVHGKIGARTHFLRFNVPETWKLEENTCLYYDSSLGYNQDIGFRGSFSWAYRAYLIGNEKKIKLYEVPLGVLDSALFYKSKSADGIWDSLKEMFSALEKFNGLIVLDWHQRVFNEKYFKNWSLIYKKCLKYFYDNDIFVSTIARAVDWIDKRDSVSISRKVSKNKTRFTILSKKDIGHFTLKMVPGNAKLNIINSKYQEISKNKDYSLIMFKKIKKNQKIIIELNGRVGN